VIDEAMRDPAEIGIQTSRSLLRRFSTRVYYKSNRFASAGKFLDTVRHFQLEFGILDI
jgi:hypothetical protein